MYRDNNSLLEATLSIAPAVYSADQNGTGVDLRGCGSAMASVTIGAITGTATAATVTFEESDDNSTWTDVADADILGSEPAGLTAATAYQFGYRGEKRYIRAVLDTGAATNIAAAVAIVKGDLQQAPADIANATSIVSAT